MNSHPSTIPEGLDLLTAPDGVIIRRVWRSWKVAPLAAFATFWDGFLVFWYLQALSKPHPEPMVLIFPLLHVGVGIGITYYVIVSFFNTTDVVVSSSGVRVVTGPAPWIGNRDVRADEMTAIVVRERTSSRGSRTFRVMYADRQRKEKTLTLPTDRREQADFIAGTIKHHLRVAAPDL